MKLLDISEIDNCVCGACIPLALIANQLKVK